MQCFVYLCQLWIFFFDMNKHIKHELLFTTLNISFDGGDHDHDDDDDDDKV